MPTVPTDREYKTHTTLPDIFRTINGVNVGVGPQERFTNAEVRGANVPWGRDQPEELAPAGFPRIVLRDALGYELDTFTTLQEAIYRAKWQVKQSGQAKTPIQWRLPKAPAPARPDLTRTFPPVKHPPVETELDKLKKRLPYSSVLEFDVEDVGFVRESLQYLPYVPSLSFLRQEVLCGPKMYFQIVGTMLLHKRVLSLTEKRNAVYSFPGFCSGCVRLGLCYGCERSTQPHYHEDKPVKTGGGFTYFKKDRPENQIKAKNPVNWKIHHPDQTLKMMMEEYAGVDLEGAIPDEIKKHLDQHGGHRERNFSQIPDFAKEMEEYNKKMSGDDERNKKLNEGHDESFLPDLVASHDFMEDHNNNQGQDDLASRVRGSGSYVKFQDGTGMHSENDLDMNDVITDREEDDYSETRDPRGHHGNGYHRDHHGNQRSQNQHVRKDSKGRSKSEEVHSRRDIIKIDAGSRSSSHGREQHRLSKLRKTTTSSDEEKDKVVDSDTSGDNERTSRSRQKLYKPPPQFKLKKSPQRRIESKSPFSTDRQFNINTGSGFEVKKSDKAPTKFKAFRNVDASWKEPKKFELKENSTKPTKFWSGPRKKKDEKKNRRSSPRARRRHSPEPRTVSPDSGLDSELMTVVVKRKSPVRNKESRKSAPTMECTTGKVSPSSLPTSQTPLDSYHDTAAEYYKHRDIDIPHADSFYNKHERVRHRGKHKTSRSSPFMDLKDQSDSDENWRKTAEEVKRLYMNETTPRNGTKNRKAKSKDKKSKQSNLRNSESQNIPGLRVQVSRSENSPDSSRLLPHELSEPRRPRTGDIGTQTEDIVNAFPDRRFRNQNMTRSDRQEEDNSNLRRKNYVSETSEDESESNENSQNDFDNKEKEAECTKGKQRLPDVYDTNQPQRQDKRSSTVDNNHYVDDLETSREDRTNRERQIFPSVHDNKQSKRKGKRSRTADSNPDLDNADLESEISYKSMKDREKLPSLYDEKQHKRQNKSSRTVNNNPTSDSDDLEIDKENRRNNERRQKFPSVYNKQLKRQGKKFRTVDNDIDLDNDDLDIWREDKSLKERQRFPSVYRKQPNRQGKKSRTVDNNTDLDSDDLDIGREERSIKESQKFPSVYGKKKQKSHDSSRQKQRDGKMIDQELRLPEINQHKNRSLSAYSQSSDETSQFSMKISIKTNDQLNSKHSAIGFRQKGDRDQKKNQNSGVDKMPEVTNSTDEEPGFDRTRIDKYAGKREENLNAPDTFKNNKQVQHARKWSNRCNKGETNEYMSDSDEDIDKSKARNKRRPRKSGAKVDEDYIDIPKQGCESYQDHVEASGEKSDNKKDTNHGDRQKRRIRERFHRQQLPENNAQSQDSECDEVKTCKYNNYQDSENGTDENSRPAKDTQIKRILKSENCRMKYRYRQSGNTDSNHDTEQDEIDVFEIPNEDFENINTNTTKKARHKYNMRNKKGRQNGYLHEANPDQLDSEQDNAGANESHYYDGENLDSKASDKGKHKEKLRKKNKGRKNRHLHERDPEHHLDSEKDEAEGSMNHNDDAKQKVNNHQLRYRRKRRPEKYLSHKGSDQLQDSEQDEEIVLESHHEKEGNINLNNAKYSKPKHRVRNKNKRRSDTNLHDGSFDQLQDSEQDEVEIYQNQQDENTDFRVVKDARHKHRKRKGNKTRSNKYILHGGSDQLQDSGIYENHEDYGENTNSGENTNGKHRDRRMIKDISNRLEQHDDQYQLDEYEHDEDRDIENYQDDIHNRDFRTRDNNKLINRKKSRPDNYLPYGYSNQDQNSEMEDVDVSKGIFGTHESENGRKDNQFVKQRRKKEFRKKHIRKETFLDDNDAITEPAITKHNRKKKSRKEKSNLADEQPGKFINIVSDDATADGNKQKGYHRKRNTWTNQDNDDDDDDDDDDGRVYGNYQDDVDYTDSRSAKEARDRQKLRNRKKRKQDGYLLNKGLDQLQDSEQEDADVWPVIVEQNTDEGDHNDSDRYRRRRIKPEDRDKPDETQMQLKKSGYAEDYSDLRSAKEARKKQKTKDRNSRKPDRYRKRVPGHLQDSDHEDADVWTAIAEQNNQETDEGDHYDNDRHQRRRIEKESKDKTKYKHLKLNDSETNQGCTSDNEEGMTINGETNNTDHESKPSGIRKLGYMKNGRKSKFIEDWLNNNSDSENNSQPENDYHAGNDQSVKHKTKKEFRKKQMRKENLHDEDDSINDPDMSKHNRRKKSRKDLADENRGKYIDIVSDDELEDRNKQMKWYRKRSRKANLKNEHSNLTIDSEGEPKGKFKEELDFETMEQDFEDRPRPSLSGRYSRRYDDDRGLVRKKENTYHNDETDVSQTEYSSDGSYISRGSVDKSHKVIKNDAGKKVLVKMDNASIENVSDSDGDLKPKQHERRGTKNRTRPVTQSDQRMNREGYGTEAYTWTGETSEDESSDIDRKGTKSNLTMSCFSPPAISSDVNFEKQSLTSHEPDLELVFDDVIDVEKIEVIDNEDDEDEKIKAEERRRRRHRHKRKKRREAEKLKEIESNANDFKTPKVSKDEQKDFRRKPDADKDVSAESDGDSKALEQVAKENKQPQYGTEKTSTTIEPDSEEESESDEELDHQRLDSRGRETGNTSRSTKRKDKHSSDRKSKEPVLKARSKERRKSRKFPEKSKTDKNSMEQITKENSSLDRKIKDNAKKQDGGKASKATVEMDKEKAVKGKKKRIRKETGDDEIDFATLPSIQSQLSKIMKGLTIPKQDVENTKELENNEDSESSLDDNQSREQIRNMTPEAKWELVRPKSVELHGIGMKVEGPRRQRSMSLPMLTDIEEMFKQMDPDLKEQLRQPFRVPIYLPSFRPGRPKKQFNPTPRRVKARERSRSVPFETDLFSDIRDSTARSELEALKEEPSILQTPTPEPASEPEPPKMDGAPTPLSLHIPTPEKPQTPPKRREIVKKERKEPKARTPAPKPPTPVREPTPSPSPPPSEEPIVTSRDISFVFDREPVVPELPPIEIPALPEIQEAQLSYRPKAKKEMKFIEVTPEIPEAKKKLPPPPKLAPRVRPHGQMRRSKVAEAPVTSQELQQLSDPLDFLAKYCIINPDRLPFYERIFNSCVSVQTPRYSRNEPPQPGAMVHLPPAVLSEHELNMLRDLTVLSHAQTPRREGISAPEQYLEKLNYTVEFVKGKQETIQDHMQKLQGEKIHYMATLAREMDRDIGRLDYKVTGKKKKKKKKKKVDIVDYDKVGAMSVNTKDFKPTKMSDITDEVIVSRMNDKMMKKVKKDPVVKTLTLEISRDIEKMKHYDQRIAQIEDEKDLVGLYCMDYYFSEQAVTARPAEFRRQQSRLYQKLHPDPDIEMNIEEVETALQQINNKLLSEKEFQYIYFVLDLPKRQKINFRLFSIIAALSEKVTQMDPVIRKLINKADYNALDVKMEKSKELFDLLQDVDYMPRGNAPADNLAVELTAGGLTPEHTNYVLSKFDRDGRGFCDFMDFVTYVPLFIQIHKRIIDDPFNDSLDV